MYHDTPHVILYSVLRALKKGGREMEDESETLEKGAVSEGERMREGHREGTREKKRGTQRGNEREEERDTEIERERRREGMREKERDREGE